MKKHLFPLAVGLLTLTACTSEEVVDISPTQGNAITFDNVVNKSTRAIEGQDLTATNFDNFLVYGYYTKEGMTTPIQIFNGVPIKKSTVNGKQVWSYDGVRYWVPSCTYYFYAYSCADVALSTGKGSPAMTLTNETTEDGRALAIFSYLCDGTHQHDLVCAENEGVLAKETKNPEVGLTFEHALCKIKASFTTDFPDGYQVKVSDVKISEFDNLADYNVGTKTWSQFMNNGSNPFINMNITGNNIITNAAGSSVETSEVFVIPKIYNNTEFVKLHFKIEVSKGKDLILERAITGTWSPNWERAHIYKYNVNISGSSAGIEAIVFAAAQSLSGSSNSWSESNEVNMVFGVDTAN